MSENPYEYFGEAEPVPILHNLIMLFIRFELLALYAIIMSCFDYVFSWQFWLAIAIGAGIYLFCDRCVRNFLND